MFIQLLCVPFSDPHFLHSSTSLFIYLQCCVVLCGKKYSVFLRQIQCLMCLHPLRYQRSHWLCALPSLIPSMSSHCWSHTLPSVQEVGIQEKLWVYVARNYMYRNPTATPMLHQRNSEKDHMWIEHMKYQGNLWLWIIDMWRSRSTRCAGINVTCIFLGV